MAILPCCRSDIISVLDTAVVVDELPQYRESARSVEVSSYLVDISLCTRSSPGCCSEQVKYTLVGEIQTNIGKFTAKQKVG